MRRRSESTSSSRLGVTTTLADDLDAGRFVRTTERCPPPRPDPLRDSAPTRPRAARRVALRAHPARRRVCQLHLCRSNKGHDSGQGGARGCAPGFRAALAGRARHL